MTMTAHAVLGMVIFGVGVALAINAAGDESRVAAQPVNKPPQFPRVRGVPA
jgi:hypothetical protein